MRQLRLLFLSHIFRKQYLGTLAIPSSIVDSKMGWNFGVNYYFLFVLVFELKQ